MVIATRKPLYQVLTDHLLQEIVSGRLKEGDKLPSKAEFAEQLDVRQYPRDDPQGDRSEEAMIKTEKSLRRNIHNYKELVGKCSSTSTR